MGHLHFPRNVASLLAVAGLVLLPALHAQEVCPPEPGTVITQESSSTATLVFQMTGGPSMEISLEGMVVTRATAVQTGVVETQIVSMSLQGTNELLGRIVLTQSKERRSMGMMAGISEILGSDGYNYCAAIDSFFDVFFDISMDGGQIVLPPLHNEIPLHMRGRGPVPLDHKKARFEFFQVTDQLVPVVDANNRQYGEVAGAVHKVEPPPPPCFPPAGIDIMDSNLFHDIDVPGIGLIRGNLSGPIRVQRSDPYTNPTTGITCIDTEIISMHLTGGDPVAGKVTIILDPCRPSKGQICEQVAGTCFPADSFFDVFIEVMLEDLGTCFYSCKPAHMSTVIYGIPPFGALYNLNLGAGNVLPLWKGPCMRQCDPTQDPCLQQPMPAPDAFIVKAVHEPLPPPDCACFPKAGYDVLLTKLAHRITLPGFNDITCSDFTGPITVKRSDPYVGLDDHCRIDTEIVRMDMKGTCSDGSIAVIHLSPDGPSKGVIRAREIGACFPADSFFDVFFEVEFEGFAAPVLFRNCEPAIMHSVINALPPIPPIGGDPYAITNAPILLYRATSGGPSPCLATPLPTPAGELENAVHTPTEVATPCCPEYGPGIDIFGSTLLHDIDIPGIPQITVHLTGPVKVQRGEPYRDPNNENRCTVDTEMVSMELTGVDPDIGPIRLTLNPRHPTRGRIVQKNLTGTCFPADSFFDVFLRAELLNMGMTLVNCQPAHMSQVITKIPPFDEIYNMDLGTVQLYQETATADVCDNPSAQVRATIVAAQHTPVPPCDCYPKPGIDEMPSELVHRVRIFGIGPGTGGLVVDADMSGPVVIVRGAPEVDPTTGLCRIPTRIDGMDLMGTDPIAGPVEIHINKTKPSVGEIRERAPGTCFPADSFFDVFIEVKVPGQDVTLVNCAPARMQAVIEAIPPYNQFYILNLSDVLLYKPAECDALPSPDIVPSGVIEIAEHVPRDPQPCCPDYGPGRDVMDSKLIHEIEILGLGQICTVPLYGKMVVDRGTPYLQPDPTGLGLCCVSTRMMSMELTGNDPICGPITVRLNPDRPTRGTICQVTPGGPCFPATSCFDVFVEIEVAGMVLVNCEAVRMCTTINGIPPYGEVYFAPGTIPLFKKGECDSSATTPAAILTKAEHTPLPCPPLEVRCEVLPIGTGASPSVKVSWVNDPDCPCKQFKVTRKDAAGAVVEIPVPAGETSIIDTPPCPPGSGSRIYTYCVVCADGGAVSREGCCEVTVTCPTCVIDNVTCEKVENEVLITWTASADCCAEFLITLDGVEAARVPGSDRQVRLPCKSGHYCVQCVLADGTVLPLNEKNCCDVKCVCDDASSTIKDLQCTTDLAAGNVTLTWSVVEPECCTKYRITLPDGTTVDSDGTSKTLPCKSGRYCVQCVKEDGSLGPQACCDVTCECDDTIKELQCISDLAKDTVTITWTADRTCCQKFIVTLPDGTTATVEGATTWTGPCKSSGEYCVQCVKVDGKLGPKVCCKVNCECDDAIKDLQCVVDREKNTVTLTWTAADRICCPRFRITRPGFNPFVETDETTYTGPCMDGKYCVQCIRQDGSLGPEVCCDVTCHLPKQRPGDCSQDNQVDISDAVCILGVLFTGTPQKFPCGTGSSTDPANIAVLDLSGDGAVDLSDAIYLLNFLFLGGKPPAQGTDCILVPNCPDKCIPD
jgi:hypothetical protein